MIKHGFLVIWILLIKCVFSYRQYRPEDVPNPLLHFEGCGGREPSNICDPSLYLTDDGLEYVQNMIDQFKNYFDGPKACDSLYKPYYEVGVAIVPSMHYYHGYEKLDIAKEFAKKLFNLWGIGDSRCNNGILLFLSIEDRVGYIATGSGARKRITDSRAQSIITYTMRSNLRWGNYDNAVIAGLEKIEEHLKGPIPSFFLFYLFIFGFIGSIGYFIYLSEQDNKRYIEMQRDVKRLETDRDALLNNNFNAETCPICLEELTFIEAEAVNEVIEQKKGYVRKQFDKGWYWIKPYWESISKFFRRIWIKIRIKYLELTSKNNKDDSDFDKLHEKLIKEDRRYSTYSHNAFGLPCGHVFCERCVKPWIERKGNCPICRQSVIDATNEVEDIADRQYSPAMYLNAAERIHSRREANLRAMRIHNDLQWQAMEFRARRLHWHYPRYVTRPMLNQFSRTPREVYLSRHEHYVREQRVRAERQRRQRESSNRSSHRNRGFGGGRASGGGGGSW